MKLRSGTRKVAVGAFALAATLPAAGLFATTADAVAGDPGVPGAPTVLFSEGFGTGLASGQVVRLDTYDGAKYTADPAWLNETAGNGLIVDGASTDAALVSAGYPGATGAGVTSPTRGGELRELASVIGALNGTSPNTANHAVTAYSDADPGANKVEFEVKNPLALDADGRFLTISANVGVENCARASAPLLKFFLLDGTTENAVNDTALNPCSGASGDAPVARTLTGGNAVLFGGDQVGIRLRNENGSGAGNDHAYDDIKVLDVTPQLDKDFEATGEEQPGDAVDLVFTVTNTSELGAKTGWEFTDHLSAGLEVAGEATSDCTAEVTAEVGATSIAVADGALADGATSCTITVPVTATRGGTFKNGPGNITSTGLNKPAVAEVTFTTPQTPVIPDDEPAAPAVVDSGVAGASGTGTGLYLLAGGLAALLGGAVLRFRQVLRRTP